MGHKKKTIPVVILLILFLGIGGYAAYKLYLSHEAYAQGDRAYAQIASQVILEDDTEDAGNDVTATKKKIKIPKRNIDFTALKQISADSIAWLYCPDTVIDYPVVAADDYTYYLSHLPDGTYNINGTLFLDYACATDFSEELSVIYGHNMLSGSMFGCFESYKEQAYYKKHPYFYLYTQEQNYRIALLYGAVMSASQWIDEDYAHNADGLLAYEKENTTFLSNVKYTGDEKLIALSTCSYDYSNARYVLLGVLQPG